MQKSSQNLGKKVLKKHCKNQVKKVRRKISKKLGKCACGKSRKEPGKKVARKVTRNKESVYEKIVARN